MIVGANLPITPTTADYRSRPSTAHLPEPSLKQPLASLQERRLQEGIE